jgi:hypothetical protein
MQNRLRAGLPKNDVSIPGRGEICLPSSEHQDCLWSQPNPLFNWGGGRGAFQRRWSGGGNKLITFVHLVPRKRMSAAAPLLLPICLHGVDRVNFFPFLWLLFQVVKQRALHTWGYREFHTFWCLPIRKSARAYVPVSLTDQRFVELKWYDSLAYVFEVDGINFIFGVFSFFSVIGHSQSLSGLFTLVTMNVIFTSFRLCNLRECNVGRDVRHWCANYTSELHMWRHVVHCNKSGVREKVILTLYSPQCRESLK